jgi:hypothetical protein
VGMGHNLASIVLRDADRAFGCSWMVLGARCWMLLDVGCWMLSPAALVFGDIIPPVGGSGVGACPQMAQIIADGVTLD